MRIVFLGTPEVAAKSLEIILSYFPHEVVAVVSQPPARKGRGGKETLSPVHELALKKDLLIFTPESAKDPAFLEALRDLKPDFCITAAYGQFLPQAFLNIPQKGTLNIHPSLLPLYRGAAPVPRAMASGNPRSGVTVAFTVLKMDSGPLVLQKESLFGEDETAQEALHRLFEEGSHLLCEHLEDIAQGKIPLKEQDHTKATEAPKMSSEEAFWDWNLSAKELYARMRAFTPWPGSKCKMKINDDIFDVKILKARPMSETFSENFIFKDSLMAVKCGNGSFMAIEEIQLPDKKPQKVRDFYNGFSKKKVEILF